MHSTQHTLYNTLWIINTHASIHKELLLKYGFLASVCMCKCLHFLKNMYVYNVYACAYKYTCTMYVSTRMQVCVYIYAMGEVV